MSEPELAAEVRQRDLPVMEVPGEYEMEDARLEAVDHPWKVAEQDAQIGVRIGEFFRSRPAPHVGAWVDPGDLDAPAAEHDCDRLVGEQTRPSELRRIRCSRERVARDPDIVVPEHRVAAVEAAEEAVQPRLAAGMRKEVTRQADEVRLALFGPVDGALDRDGAARRGAEMEVREVDDPQPAELLG